MQILAPKMIIFNFIKFWWGDKGGGPKIFNTMHKYNKIK